MLLMAATLSEHQIAAFLEALQENLEENTRELLDRDDEAFREESLDRLLDNLQRYLGKLSSEQKSDFQTVSIITAASMRYGCKTEGVACTA